MDANLWFRNWASGNGQKLSNVQMKRLVTLTRKWRSNISSENLRVWTSNPSAEFWGFEPFRTESAWVRECLEIKVPTFEDHDEKFDDCEKALVRRRVLLIILCDIIQREVARLRASFEAQPHKFLSTAARNIVEQAYPGEYDKKLYDRCIHLQRFERAKIENVEVEALVAFAEAIYDKKYQSDLQKAFECILKTCPFRQSGNLRPRLPSSSTRKRLRKKAMRAKNTWKPSVPSTISHQIGTQATQEHVLDSNSSRLRPILNPRAEAQKADQIISQLGIQQQSNNNVMSSAPMGIHSSDDQVPVPALLEGPTTLGRQQVPADPSRYRFCDSMLLLNFRSMVLSMIQH
ncbi:similar to An12g06820 [Aspergillus luchuensis IFO 4308]|nr:similar to An12g06820 [Aspergillus luchuensis IFO 4308]